MGAVGALSHDSVRQSPLYCFTGFLSGGSGSGGIIAYMLHRGGATAVSLMHRRSILTTENRHNELSVLSDTRKMDNHADYSTASTCQPRVVEPTYYSRR